MLSSDWWHLLMALAVIVAPLWLAAVLLAWGEHKRERDPGAGSAHRRTR